MSPLVKEEQQPRNVLPACCYNNIVCLKLEGVLKVGCIKQSDWCDDMRICLSPLELSLPCGFSPPERRYMLLSIHGGMRLVMLRLPMLVLPEPE